MRFPKKFSSQCQKLGTLFVWGGDVLLLFLIFTYPFAEIGLAKRPYSIISDPDFDPDSDKFQENLRSLVEANFQAEDSEDEASNLYGELKDFTEKVGRCNKTAVPKITEGKVYWVPLAHDMAANWKGDFRLAIRDDFLAKQIQGGRECVTKFRDARLKDPVTVSGHFFYGEGYH